MYKNICEFLGITLLISVSLLTGIICIWFGLYAFGVETVIYWKLLICGIVVASAMVTAILYFMSANKWGAR